MRKLSPLRPLMALASLLTATAFTALPVPASNPNQPAEYAIFCDPNDTGLVQSYFETTTGMPLFCSVATNDGSGNAGAYLGAGIPFTGPPSPIAANNMRFFVTDPAWTPYVFVLQVNYTAPDGTTHTAFPGRYTTKTKRPTQVFYVNLQDNGIPAGSKLNYATFTVREFVPGTPVNVTIDEIDVNGTQLGKILGQSYPYCPLEPISDALAIPGSAVKGILGGPSSN